VKKGVALWRNVVYIKGVRETDTQTEEDGMKTKTRIETTTYYDHRCEAVEMVNREQGQEPDIFECDGTVDHTTGICRKCGHQNNRESFEEEIGVVYYRVSVSGRDSAEFHCNAGDDDEYDRKIVAAIKRAGGSGNGVWMDGCKNPDGHDGHYGRFLDRKLGGGFSVHGRFSVERI